jgi:hypothetical protein
VHFAVHNLATAVYNLATTEDTEDTEERRGWRVPQPA